MFEQKEMMRQQPIVYHIDKYIKCKWIKQSNKKQRLEESF